VAADLNALRAAPAWRFPVRWLSRGGSGRGFHHSPGSISFAASLPLVLVTIPFGFEPLLLIFFLLVLTPAFPTPENDSREILIHGLIFGR
jgi:hypothetical protein